MQSSFVSPPVPDRARPFGALMGDVLRRPGGRRALSVLSVVLFLAGVAMFGYPVGTDVYSQVQQGHLDNQFASPQLQQAYRVHKVPVGQVLTRLIIPQQGINLDVLVVEGTSPAALRAGAGHYPGTPLPGDEGNVAIAGHRTTFGRPFNHLDEMHPGSLVILETPFARYTYVAVQPFASHANPWVVSPTDYGVVANQKGVHLLTLTTCNPKGSARERLVLRLELTTTEKLQPKAP